MSEIEEIEARIRNLPEKDLAKFRDWFIQFEEDLWDQQIKHDCQAGKFSQLMTKAREEFANGKAREF